MGIWYWSCDLAKKGNTEKGNYDGLDEQVTWMGVGRLDKEGMIRLDKGVMGITKKGNLKRKEPNMGLAVTFQKRK